MKKKKVLEMLNFSSVDLKDIERLIEESERNTRGEIAVAVIDESDDYSLYELLCGIVFAVIIFSCMVPFAQSIYNYLYTIFWYPSLTYLLVTYGIVVLLTMFLFFTFANISAIDRIIIPQKIQEKKVYERAIRYFAESGLYKTELHSGILIFISLLEHRVIVIADKGVNEKVPQARWDLICKEITKGIKNKKGGIAIKNAISDCGSILTELYPNTNTVKNQNEIANGLVILNN